MSKPDICNKAGIYKKMIEIAWVISIFVCLFLFYTVIHPMYIFDIDDWTYISYRRIAAPVWGAWNPAKVFPEAIMPMIGYGASYLIYPFIGDYIRSLMYAAAFVTTVLITLYVVMFYRFCINKFQLNRTISALISVIFLEIHYFLYCTKLSDNMHVFYASSVNGFFNYIAPALLNGIVVLFIMGSNEDITDFFDGKKKFIKGILIAAAYFALLSNMFHSIILASYVGLRLISDLVIHIKTGNGIPYLLKKNLFNIGCIVVWLFGMVFEAHGMRASNNSLMSFDIGRTFLNGLSRIKEINWIILIIGILVVLLSLFLFFTGRGSEKLREEFKKGAGYTSAGALLVFIYLVLLCTVVDPSYIEKNEVIVSFTVYVVLLLFVSVLFVINNCGWTLYFVPLAILIIPTTCNAFHGEKSRVFMETQGIDHKILYTHDCDILDQFLEADRNGKESMVLIIRGAINDRDWMTDMFGNRISHTLYKHGIVSRDMEVTVKIEDDAQKLNEDYYVSNEIYD